jgi:hypothetical protein
MLTEIPAALAAVKNLKDISTFILNSKIDNAVKAKAVELNSTIIELQNAIFALQSQHQEVRDTKDELKKELMRKEKWDAEAAKYHLQDLDSGIFVYGLKRDKADSEPPHWLCIKCYQCEQKSVLQRTSKSSSGLIYTCYTCQNSFAVGKVPEWVNA